MLLFLAVNDDHGVIINGPNGNRHKSSSVSKCTRMCLIYYMTVTDIQPRSPGDLLSTGQRIKSTVQSWWEIFSSPSVRHNNMQILTQNTLVLRSRDKSNKTNCSLSLSPSCRSFTDPRTTSEHGTTESLGSINAAPQQYKPAKDVKCKYSFPPTVILWECWW